MISEGKNEGTLFLNITLIEFRMEAVQVSFPGPGGQKIKIEQFKKKQKYLLWVVC